jgi:hypothetical protein
MVLIAGLVMFAQIASEPNLIQKSRLLMEVGDWNESQYTVGKYLWWTSDQIIADGKKEPLIIDFKLGHTIPSPEYQPIFSEGLVEPTRYVSKEIWNGNVLTWIILDATGKNQIASWTSKTLAPRPMLDADNGYPGPFLQFSSDKRSLFQIEYWQGDKKVNTQITERRFPNVLEATTHPVSKISYDSSIEVIGRNVLLAPYFQFRPEEDYRMKEWSIDKTSKECRNWIVPLPKGKIFGQRFTSPDQKRSLWIFERSPNDAVRAESVWVSDLHGENMKEIGEIVFSPDGQDKKESASRQNFGGIQWNPDSKRISYIFMRKLYIVQAVP